jgi:hypothetical protein
MSKHCIKFIFTSLLLFSIVFNASAKKDTVSVGKAFLKKTIKLEIKGKGGYQQECISMKIKSTIGDTLIVFVEAGRRLDSQDSSMQDILIVRDQYLTLGAQQEKTINVFGFCCQAHNKAPAEKSIFSVGDIADKPLADLARYINSSKLNASSMQQAVWVVSDNNELSSVVDDNTDEVKNLRKFLAKLKNIETPWYNTFYKKEAQSLFSGKPEKVTGEIDYMVTNDLAMVLINIRDAAGTIVKSYFVSKGAMRGEYKYKLDWDVSKMTKGNYTVRVYENQRELKKLTIKLN